MRNPFRNPIIESSSYLALNQDNFKFLSIIKFAANVILRTIVDGRLANSFIHHNSYKHNNKEIQMNEISLLTYHPKKASILLIRCLASQPT